MECRLRRLRTTRRARESRLRWYLPYDNAQQRRGTGELDVPETNPRGVLQRLVRREFTTRTGPLRSPRTLPNAGCRGTDGGQSRDTPPSRNAASPSRTGTARVPRYTRCPP